jgi:hypothetical protein
MQLRLVGKLQRQAAPIRGSLNSIHVMNWKRTIIVICVAYAIAGFCQAIYLFVLGHTGHGGPRPDLVVMLFLVLPFSVIESALRSGMNRTMVIALAVFVVVFFTVIGSAIWWGKRKRVVHP